MKGCVNKKIMASYDNDCDSSCLEELKLNINDSVTRCSIINGTDYTRKNKLLAALYAKIGKDMDAVFHLTESHAATLRQKVLYKSTVAELRNKKDEAKTRSSSPIELQTEYLSFDSDYFHKGPGGVMERLEEMPQEWTIVQLTFEVNKNEKFYGSFKTDVPDMLSLYLARLPCGKLVKERSPSMVVINPPKDFSSDGLNSVLQVVIECIKKITLPGPKKQKAKNRAESSNDMKNIISREVLPAWLKEWSCLMIGTLYDEHLRNLVNDIINQSLKSCDQEQISKISKQKMSILYQIADGCAHLNENEILKAIRYCVGASEHISSLLYTNICEFKKEHSHALLRAKRNPVLLILDDNLDVIPWEMLPTLYKHPVCRIPSLHFVHALYKNHKDYIVNGNRIVKNTSVSFYLVNPDRDFDESEKTLLKFFQKRHPEWKGIAGEKPAGDELVKSLQDYNVFVYSGHGNGFQYLNPKDICKIDTDVIPLLFGCSSAAKRFIGEGGMLETYGVSDAYLLAGCPCYLGMLWPVLSTDTDLVTMVLLNSTMSGPSVNINDIVGSEVVEPDEVFQKEPELLRALKLARSAPKLYTNSAALIVRGIPVEFED